MALRKMLRVGFVCLVATVAVRAQMATPAPATATAPAGAQTRPASASPPAGAQSGIQTGSGVTTGTQTDATPSPAASGAQNAAPAAGAPAPAQITAAPTPGVTRVHGTITDPDGELIPGATVTLTPAKGAGIVVKSGSDGTYNAAVAPGTITLVVSMPGFATYSALNVKIPAVSGTTVNVKMQVGTQSQVINVEANAIQLSVDPEANQSAVVLSGAALDQLSDDPDELSSELTALAGPSVGPNGGQIYVDGFTGGQLPPKSSIREIRINQNPFSAQYDRLGYGRIEIFTKPGTDKLHGNFQINGNPSQFNSSDPLTNTYQPPYHTLFMFGNLTGPLNKSASYNLGGTFRQIQDDEFTNATLLASPSAPDVLCLPGDLTCGLSKIQQSTYYPQIRADINPRLDLALGQKNVLTTRYQFVKNTATNDGVGNLTLPSAGYDTSTTSNIIQLSDTQTYSTRLINETRFEYEREHLEDTALTNTPSLTVSGDFVAGGYTEQNLTDHQDHYELQNYTSLQLKKNFIRFGGRLRATREAQDTGNNTNGSFTYASSGQYMAGVPNQFAITVVNNHKIGDTDTDLGMYLETDWKARQNLTISYGFRYETQNHLSDHHDIAPRVSFNYGLFSGKGAPKTVLRGGFGIFYDRFLQANVLTLEQENGINETVYTDETNLTPACTPAAASSGAGGLAANLIAACGATASAQTVYTATSNLRSPYYTEFAGGADQQLGRIATMSVNYLHSQGVHALATQNIGYDFADPAQSTPHYQYFSEGVFKQNQLIVNGRMQAGRKLSLFGYYSLNSAHGDSSGAGTDISTPGDIAADYGRTTFDIRNRLFLGGFIVLPKYIQFSPFMIAQSGDPYNITTGSDNNDDTFFNDRPDLVTGVTPNGGTIKSIAGCGTFAQPGVVAGARVTPINDCTGPPLFTFNFRLTKTIGFGPSNHVQAGNGGPQGGPQGGPPPPGGGRRGGGGGGGPFGGGGARTNKRYNVAFGLQVQNLFNNADLAVPQGALSSLDFGLHTQLQGAPYTTNAALRRITLQASFQF